MAPGPGLTIDIAEKRYPGAETALFERLQFEIAPSSIVALIGPSGVGKSTLLRMAAGIDTDFLGTIAVEGQRADTAPTPGFVFQDARLLPWLTAEQNIRAVSPATTRVAALQALDRVGLADAAALFPHQISGGMQRRVALARALSVNARLLLLDEPFVSLDRELVAELQEQFVQRVAETRPTVLLVTHLADDAARLADRAIMLAGRPARLAGDVALPIPPAQRDEATWAAYRGLLTDLSPNTP